jgi:hypothetical protein
MVRAVRIRCLVIRLRRRPTWEAQRLADLVEAKLLREMGWER